MAQVTVWIILPGQSWSSLHFVEAQYGGPVLDAAYGLATSPDGNHLYAAGYYDGVIAVFSRDSATGGLTLIVKYNGMVSTALTDSTASWMWP